MRKHRVAAGLTQEELAARSGIGVRTISDLERGRTTWPHRRSVDLLSGVLGLAAPARGELAAGSPAGLGETGTLAPVLAAGAVYQSSAQHKRVVPRQLPATVRYFAGRSDELKVLDSLVERSNGAPGTVVISAITGMAGVGKTALAVYWAHQVAVRFPDGQLYVNLRGFDPSGAPVAPADAIRDFLDAFQVPAEQIPASLEAQASLYRSLLAGQNVLIVLDNARDAAQVRPLLPGSPGCMVVVTSRRELANLAAIEGAHLLTLDVLTEAEAGELLTARLGARRAAAEPKAVSELTALCARLPLALSITAARAATRPGFALAALAAELGDARSRLDALDAGEQAINVRAVFSWSGQGLSTLAARMFRLLELHPGPEITVPAAASLAAVDRRQARAALAELTRLHMITEYVPGRFAAHDLLRAYAAELASDLPVAVRRAAIHRILDHYLHTATAAALLLDQIDPPESPPPAVPGTAPEELADRGDAYAWFGAERPVLTAAISYAARHGFGAHAWQLANALKEFYLRHALDHDWVTIQQIALAAARRADDPAAQAHSHRYLGAALIRLHLYRDAQAELARGLNLYRSLNDRQGEGRIYFQMALLFRARDDYHRALIYGRRARRLLRACGRPADEAHALNAIGWFHAQLGNHRLAQAYGEKALSMHRLAGTRLGEALTLQILSSLRLRAGHHQQAISLLQQAIGTCRETGDRLYHADLLYDFGHAYHAAGNLAAARDCWRQAVTTLDDLRHPDADKLRAKLQDTNA